MKAQIAWLHHLPKLHHRPTPVNVLYVQYDFLRSFILPPARNSLTQIYLRTGFYQWNDSDVGDSASTPLCITWLTGSNDAWLM